MPQMAFKIIASRRTVYSFTTGIIHVSPRSWKIRNDNDAQAYALYLERQGKNHEAELFLEQYLQALSKHKPHP